MLSNRQKFIVSGLLACVLLAGLSGCGFRLRGGFEVPPELQQIHITGPAVYAPLTIEFRRVLKRAGAEVLDSDAAASAILEIKGNEFKRRVLSVDAQGRAAEYEINYRYTFRIVTNKKVVLVPEQTIQVMRDYRFDPNNVLAKEQEAAQIQEEMIRFSVNQAMRRIDAILSSQN